MRDILQLVYAFVTALFLAESVWLVITFFRHQIKRELCRRSNLSLTALIVFSGIAVHVCATKPQTNDTDNAGAPVYGLLFNSGVIGGESDETWRENPSNAFINVFTINNGTGHVEMCWAEEQGIYVCDEIKIFATDDLTALPWTNVLTHIVDSYETNYSFNIDFNQFPTSYLNRAFISFATQYDGDADGIADDIERRVFGSSPEKYDTDGDGLSDGDEYVLGTNPRELDSDGDGLTDAEETGGVQVLEGEDFLWFDTSAGTPCSFWDGSDQDWTLTLPWGYAIGGGCYSNCCASMYGEVSFGNYEIKVDVWGKWMSAYHSQWGSRIASASVSTNGNDYFVIEFDNIGRKKSNGGASPLLSCQYIFPRNETNVAYVSYRRVDDGFTGTEIRPGVVLENVTSPFDPDETYTILPPAGHYPPHADTTYRYMIGIGSDPAKYNRYYEPELAVDFNPDAYCTIDVVASSHAHIVFSGNGPSDLPDPDFFAMPNETNSVKILIGKSYEVTSDAVISCIGVSDSETVVSNVTANSFSVVRPVEIVAMEGNGASFLMMVAPAGLGGVFNWTRYCRPITGVGNEFWYVDSADCGCGGCYASGFYIYEGFSMPCVGGYCGCPDYDDDDERYHTEPDDGPYVASISLEFSKPAVIFEDAYENNPTSTVPLRSTQNTLTCVVHGGAVGGFAEFELVNASKVSTVGVGLPEQIFVPPAQKLEFEVDYEGAEPSGSVNDIVITGTFTPRTGGQRLTAYAQMTSVRVELEAVYVAPQNSCQNRHVLGIGELMYCYLMPAVNGILVEVTDANVTGSGASRIITWGVASGNHEMTVKFGSVIYKPMLSILFPDGIEGLNPHPETYGLSPGQAGGLKLVQGYKVLPLAVSFSRILIEEVPCGEELPASGYFLYMPTNIVPRVHNELAGAGNWLHIGEGNIVSGQDYAGAGFSLPWMTADGLISDDASVGWIDGNLVWKIPFGWNNLLATNGLPPAGVFAEDTRQVFSITSNGDFGVSKLGNCVERKVNGEVYCNGLRAE